MTRPEASLAIQVLPKFKHSQQEEADLIRVVDAVIAHLKNQGLKVHVGPFESTIDGPLNKLTQLLRECLDICIQEGAHSVSANIKLYYTPNEGILSIDEKINKHL